MSSHGRSACGEFDAESSTPSLDMLIIQFPFYLRFSRLISSLSSSPCPDCRSRRRPPAGPPVICHHLRTILISHSMLFILSLTVGGYGLLTDTPRTNRDHPSSSMGGSSHTHLTRLVLYHSGNTSHSRFAMTPSSQSGVVTE
jgi:hypothetical protein